MKKKNIFFVLLICFINSSCNKEEQTDELQDKDFYSDVTTRASYISGTITGEMNPYVSDGYYTYDLYSYTKTICRYKNFSSRWRSTIQNKLPRTIREYMGNPNSSRKKPFSNKCIMD